MSEPAVNTNVQVVDMDLESILNPGAASVLIPDTKATIFTRNAPDNLTFLNDKAEDDDEEDKTSTEKVTNTVELDEEGNPKVKVEPPITSSEIDTLINEDDEAKKSAATGRPKVDKNGLAELANKLIEKKLLVPFDDDKPLEKYSLQEFEELFEANDNNKKIQLRQEVETEFWTNMPEEVQYVGKYLAQGGQDLKGLFKILGAVEEVRQLDSKNENDQKQIVRSYLQATNFGSTEDIEEEINAWDDRGELEAKANKFKPKLDAMSEQQVQFKLQQQAQFRKQQGEQAQQYMANIHKTLEPANLNGLALDKKTQNRLFAGLVQPSYESVSGKQTNLLGHLLEKYQFIEPNHALIAEALWLLDDPDGYKSKVRELTKKEVVTETVRKLKSEEKNKIASHVVEDDEEQRRTTGGGIPRPSKDFFKR